MRLFQYLLIILFASALFSCENKNEQTTIYLVRHAEKDTTVKNDNPPLIQEGKERAERLVDELADEKIKYIYSTKYDRNINTVKPLSKAKNTEIQIYEWHKWEPMLDSLKTIPGTHVICGHGDNLLPMIDFLGTSVGKDELGHQEYDNLFRVVLDGGDVSGEIVKF